MVQEDHPTPRQSVVLALKSLGHQGVHAAANGLEALPQLRRRGSLDMVIGDIRMPEADGLTCLRLAVREQRLKVVILVSGDSPELCRAISHLAKPHKLQVLGEIGGPICLSILTEQIDHHESRNKPATSEHNNCISTDATIQTSRDHDINAFFQPRIVLIIDLECNSEASIRLKHAKPVALSPIYFLSLIRHHNLQFELTQVVLDRSLAVIAAGCIPLPLNSVSLNLEIADLYRVPAGALTPEITEGELDQSPASRLARQLEPSIVAEGIETLEPLQSPRAPGCSTGQAPLFAPAMPGNAYRRWRESRPVSANPAANSDTQ